MSSKLQIGRIAVFYWQNYCHRTNKDDFYTNWNLKKVEPMFFKFTRMQSVLIFCNFAHQCVVFLCFFRVLQQSLIPGFLVDKHWRHFRSRAGWQKSLRASEILCLRSNFQEEPLVANRRKQILLEVYGESKQKLQFKEAAIKKKYC